MKIFDGHNDALLKLHLGLPGLPKLMNAFKRCGYDELLAKARL